MTRPATNRRADRLAKKEAAQSDSLTVLTIGHSTRTIEEFIRLLQVHDVTRVVDVRTIPRSRHNPQFNRDTLPASLKKVEIGYTHIAELGGRRSTTRDSVNTGWRNASFRGYADYMQTPEFQEGVEQLIRLAREDRLALMCAEAVPWRCHRSLIEDALWVRGIPSEDIMSMTLRRRHALTPFAKVRGTRITYPAIVARSADTPGKLPARRAKAARALKPVSAKAAQSQRKKSSS
jgi:uncharacterized protein (DUF488 family)